jgi:hypothetical protein
MFNYRLSFWVSVFIGMSALSNVYAGHKDAEKEKATWFIFEQQFAAARPPSVADLALGKTWNCYTIGDPWRGGVPFHGPKERYRFVRRSAVLSFIPDVPSNPVLLNEVRRKYESRAFRFIPNFTMDLTNLEPDSTGVRTEIRITDSGDLVAMLSLYNSMQTFRYNYCPKELSPSDTSEKQKSWTEGFLPPPSYESPATAS